MYVYGCNAILMTALENRSDKEMILYFTELTTDFKRRKIKPGFHFMDNGALPYLKMIMIAVDIK